MGKSVIRGSIVFLYGVSVFLICSTTPTFALHYIEPYLQSPTTDSMTILWWTDSSQPNSYVDYGIGSYSNTVTASNDYVSQLGLWKHEVKITGLSAQTTYNYRTRSGSAYSGEYTFQTAINRSSNFRVAVLGDGRTDNSTVIDRHRYILNKAARLNPNLIFEAGDMVYNGSDYHWKRLFREVLTKSNSTSTVASRIPYHTAVGNHEIYDGGYAGGNLTTSMARYKALFANPDNGSSNSNWKERYYTIKYGVATFIVLDLNNTSNDAYDNHDYLNDGDTPDWEPGSEQYNWMVNQLQQAQDDSAFTFIIAHPSPYSRGVHGDPSDSQRGYELRTLDSVFRQYGVDAVLTSHDHTVEHCLTGSSGYESEMDVTDPDNLNYIVMGNSGYSSRYADSGWEDWMSIHGDGNPPYYTTYFYSWAGDSTKTSFLDINFVNEGENTWRADFRIVRNDDNVYDSFSLERRDAGLAADWNTSNGDWSNDDNWDGGGPDSTIYAYINNGGAANVTSSGQSCYELVLGEEISENGTVIISAGSLSSTNERIGNEGQGIISQTGGTHSVSGTLYLGYQSSATGTYTLSGGTLDVGTLIVGNQGTGTFTISNSSATVNINGKLKFGANGTFNVNSSATIHMKGTDLENESTSSSNLSGLENTTFIFEGGESVTDLLEVAGEDKGTDSSGWSDNFVIGTLQLGGADKGRIQLVDNFDNQPSWSGTEALYVNNIVFNLGAYIDLNNINLYYLNGGDPKQLFYGDADLDGAVGGSDLNTLLSNWGGSNKLWADGDFNGDTTVGGDDLNKLLSNWGSGFSSSAQGATTVPEPASFIIFTIVSLLYLRKPNH